AEAVQLPLANLRLEWISVPLGPVADGFGVAMPAQHENWPRLPATQSVDHIGPMRLFRGDFRPRKAEPFHLGQEYPHHRSFVTGRIGTRRRDKLSRERQ